MLANRSRLLKEIAIAIAIAVMVFVVYAVGDARTPSTDTAGTLQVALSLLHEGNVDLNEYRNHGGNTLKFNGHELYFFPLGTPLLATPIVFVIDGVLKHVFAFDLYEYLKTAPDLEVAARIQQVIASLIAALTCLVIYGIGRLSLSRGRAVALALIFAFCTPAWSTASRDLWQHTASILLISSALYLILLAERKPSLIQFASLPLAFAYVVRPTNSISILFLTLFVFLKYRPYFLRYVAWAAPVAILLFASNLALYGSIMQPYYLPQRLGSNPDFVQTLAATLVSPSRGLLVYVPVVLLAGGGVILKLREGRFGALDLAISGIIVAHWLAISSFVHWWGGASFGPRLFTDIMPYFIYLMIPVLAGAHLPQTAGRWAMATAAGGLILVSFLIHYRGATQEATWLWNMAFLKVVPSVDDDPARLWNWHDPQFWRGLRPARLAVTPLSLCYTLPKETDSAEQPQITLANPGDKAFRWSAVTPRRVTASPAFPEVPALGYGELALTLDATGYGAGVHSLGGVYLSAYDENGNPVQGSPFVIPVALQVPSSSEHLAAKTAARVASDCSAAPVDILIDGRTQSLLPDQMQALYGAGWYDMEAQGDFTWHWAASPASVYVFSPTAQSIQLTSTPLTLHVAGSPNGMGGQGNMTVAVNDQDPNTVPVQVGQPFTVSADLRQGWNVITFALESGNYRSVDVDPKSGDTRELSFSLGTIDLRAR
jgi:hypothetical protein